AEDGIRDFHVTGVQTCALPIYQAGGNFTGNGATALRSAADVTAGGSIALNGTADGPHALSLQGGTLVDLGGAATVGALTAAATTIDLANVTTTAAQTYTGTTRIGGSYGAGGSFTVNGATELKAATDVTAETVNLTGPVTGPYALSLL